MGPTAFTKEALDGNAPLASFSMEFLEIMSVPDQAATAAAAWAGQA